MYSDITSQKEVTAFLDRLTYDLQEYHVLNRLAQASYNKIAQSEPPIHPIGFSTMDEYKRLAFEVFGSMSRIVKEVEDFIDPPCSPDNG